MSERGPVFVLLHSPMLPVLCTVALVIAGCPSVSTQPYITDFTNDKVRVNVNYSSLHEILGGSTLDVAKTASMTVAKEQCRSYKKVAEYVSSFRTVSGDGWGTYHFLYRCVGPDTG